MDVRFFREDAPKLVPQPTLMERRLDLRLRHLYMDLFSIMTHDEQEQIAIPDEAQLFPEGFSTLTLKQQLKRNILPPVIRVKKRSGKSQETMQETSLSTNAVEDTTATLISNQRSQQSAVIREWMKKKAKEMRRAHRLATSEKRFAQKVEEAEKLEKIERLEKARTAYKEWLSRHERRLSVAESAPEYNGIDSVFAENNEVPVLKEASIKDDRDATISDLIANGTDANHGVEEVPRKSPAILSVENMNSAELTGVVTEVSNLELQNKPLILPDKASWPKPKATVMSVQSPKPKQSAFPATLSQTKRPAIDQIVMSHSTLKKSEDQLQSPKPRQSAIPATPSQTKHTSIDQTASPQPRKSVTTENDQAASTRPRTSISFDQWKQLKSKSRSHEAQLERERQKLAQQLRDMDGWGMPARQRVLELLGERRRTNLWKNWTPRKQPTKSGNIFGNSSSYDPDATMFYWPNSCAEINRPRSSSESRQRPATAQPMTGNERMKTMVGYEDEKDLAKQCKALSVISSSAEHFFGLTAAAPQISIAEAP